MLVGIVLCFTICNHIISKYLDGPFKYDKEMRRKFPVGKSIIFPQLKLTILGFCWIWKPGEDAWRQDWRGGIDVTKQRWAENVFAFICVISMYLVAFFGQFFENFYKLSVNISENFVTLHNFFQHMSLLWILKDRKFVNYLRLKILLIVRS